MLRKILPFDKVFIILAALLGLLLIALGILGNNGIITYTQLKRNYKEMQQRVEKLDKENQKLVEEINQLRDNPEYIERIAREELGMVKPGEVLYRIRHGGNK